MTKMKMNRAARFAAACTMMTALACEGAFTIKFGSAMEVIEGGVTNFYAQNDTIVPTAVPCLYMMRMGGLAEGEKTYCVNGSDNFSRFPMYGDGDWVRVAVAGDDETTVTLTGRKVKQTYYVDAEHGKDDWDGTADYEHRDESTRKGPKQSLQAAHDAVAAGSDAAGYPLILAAPGVYSNGVTTVYSSGTDNPINRRLVVRKVLGIRAIEGAENTFIVGAPDPATGGLGADAVAGVDMTANVNIFLQGFTITGCYTPSSAGNYVQYGAALCTGSAKSQVLDCIISNNVAARCSVNASGIIQRTKIFDNQSANFISWYGSFISCIFAGNRITAGDNTSIDDGGSGFYFCTFDLRNELNPSGRRRLENDNAQLYGCLVYGLTNKSRTTNERWHDSIATDYPVFGDADARDYRLGALSPALDASSYSDMANSERSRMVSDNGGLLPVLHDGKMRLGAVWNEPTLPVTEILGIGGEISVSGGSAGTNAVLAANEITVTATQGASRPLAGFEVNGEMVVTTGVSYSFTPSTTAGSVTSVKAIYGGDWYVDCVNGDDANDGGSLARAKKTIRAATTNAVAGDVIHVAPGTYGELEGTQKAPANSLIGTRVVIPANVTIESTSGAEKTFIVGAAATGDQIDNETYGTGTNAVRCVYPKDNATLRGFTLTGGRTIGASEAGGDGMGAACYPSQLRTATLENCIISNNVSNLATIFRTIVRGCRVIGNRVISTSGGGSGCYTCSIYNSIIDKNIGPAVISYPLMVESCTIGSGNTLANGSNTSAFMFSAADRWLINTVVLGGGYSMESGGHLYCTNCLVKASNVGNVLKREQSYNTIFTNEAAMQVDSEYRPVLGSFAGIDRGDVAYSSEPLADTDIYGTPRVLNGQIDIGAVEYDWRPKFSEELGRRFTVTYASPSVTTNATGGLLVPDGAVAGKVTSAGPYAIAFTLTGGSLAVYVGGELAGESSGTGEQSIWFTVANAADEVRFVYTPEAGSTAVLKKLSGARGFSISIR